MRGASQDETIRTDITSEPVSVHDRPLDTGVVEAGSIDSEEPL